MFHATPVHVSYVDTSHRDECIANAYANNCCGININKAIAIHVPPRNER